MLFFYQTITTTKLTDEHHNLQMNKDKQINEKSAQRDANTARCLCRWVPSSIYVPNLKRISLFIEKFLRGPENRKLGHVTLATPT